MSIFTKIFVVLTMVTAVLLLALVVPFVVNTNTYKGSYATEKNLRVIAEANAAARENEISGALQSANSQITALNSQLAALDKEIRTRDEQLQQAQAQGIALQNANADVRTELGRLSAGLQQQAQINAMLQDEVRERRENMLKLQTRNIELAEQLRDKTTQSDTLVREVRLIKEQMADLETQNRDLLNQVQSGAGRTATATAAAPGAPRSMAEGSESAQPIRGLVTDVQKIGDESFVAVNVGSNDGVREGMRFLVHRGDQFLGNIVITKVDLNSAAGRITLRRGEITANTEVLSGGI